MNQHYVPRVYLKNFAKIVKKEYYVDVYDKLEKRYFESNIKNLCAEKHLYTLPENSEISSDRYLMEKFLSDTIEPMYQRTYDLLTNDHVRFLSGYHRAEILMGIFQLYSRNPFLFKEAIAKHKLNIEALYNDAVKKRDRIIEYNNIRYDLTIETVESIFRDISRRTMTIFKERNISGIKELGMYHQEIIIEVCKIDDDSYYITGDNPIPLEDRLVNNTYPLLRSKEFYVTLNSKYCVKLYHDTSLTADIIYRTSMPNASAAMINEKVFKQSKRFIIGLRKSIVQFFDMLKTLQNTNIHQLMHAVEQILTMRLNKPETEDHRKAKEALRHFHNIYIQKNDLTDEEFSELARTMSVFMRKTIKNRIT